MNNIERPPNQLTKNDIVQSNIFQKVTKCSGNILSNFFHLNNTHSLSLSLFKITEPWRRGQQRLTKRYMAWLSTPKLASTAQATSLVHRRGLASVGGE